MASRSIPTFAISASSSSFASVGAAQASPQPAEMIRGTGIMRPGAPAALQAFSIAIASAVV